MPELNVVQGSPAWTEARKGRPTGSDFKRFLKEDGKRRTGEMPRTYMAELIAESLGWEKEFRGSPDCARGHHIEPIAQRWVKLRTGVEFRDCGIFISADQTWGDSPDGISTDGRTVFECKAPGPKSFLQWRMNGDEIPPEHLLQAHAHLLASGAERCIWVAYPDHPSLDPLMVVLERNEFTEDLRPGVESFCAELKEKRAALISDPAYIPEWEA